MASQTEVVNIALGRIGITRRLADVLTDTTKEALQARLIYDTALDETLRSFPWNFALTSVALAETAEAVVIPGYEVQYQYPTGCVMAHAVCDEDGLRQTYEAWATSWESTRMAPPRYPFRVALHPDGDRRVILTDLEDAYLIYTARVTDTSVWDALFTSAFAWKLAYELAMPLVEGSEGQRRQQQAAQGYFNAVQSAMAQSFNESVEDERPQSPSILARE
jgi:hypothetical protein